MSTRRPAPITDLPAALRALATDWLHRAGIEQFGAIACTERELAEELLDLVRRAGEHHQIPAHFLDEIAEVRK